MEGKRAMYQVLEQGCARCKRTQTGEPGTGFGRLGMIWIWRSLDIAIRGNGKWKHKRAIHAQYTRGTDIQHWMNDRVGRWQGKDEGPCGQESRLICRQWAAIRGCTGRDWNDELLIVRDIGLEGWSWSPVRRPLAVAWVKLCQLN